MMLRMGPFIITNPDGEPITDMTVGDEIKLFCARCDVEPAPVDGVITCPGCGAQLKEIKKS